MKAQKIEITVIESTDPSVQCIHALRQIMDYFTGSTGAGSGLSPMGNDKKAVINWFISRYPAELPNITIGGKL